MFAHIKPLPSAADLWEWYSFNPLTGEVFSRRRNRKALGSLTRSGYLILGRAHHGSQLTIHRLVWKWITGNDPDGTIDHINRNRSDNRHWNLKLATVQEQNRNKRNIKLNPDKVRQIRARIEAGELPGAIAPDFGVSRETVVAVKQRRIWKDVV